MGGENMTLMLDAQNYFKNNQQIICIEKREPQDNYPEHTHNFDEIVIVTAGTGKHILNGYPHKLHQGMIFYIRSSDVHLYAESHHLTLTNILLQDTHNFMFLRNIESMLTLFTPQKSIYKFVHKKSLPQINTLIEEMHQLNLQQNNYLTECLFFQLMTLLKQNQITYQKNGSTEEKGVQVLKWLATHFEQDLDWNKVAHNFALPLRTLYRFIKNYTGLAPQQYVMKLRLAEAYYQLHNSDKSIINIAVDCGFKDQSYFSTCFKNEYKLCPSLLRAAG